MKRSKLVKTVESIHKYDVDLRIHGQKQWSDVNYECPGRDILSGIIGMRSLSPVEGY